MKKFLNFLSTVLTFGLLLCVLSLVISMTIGIRPYVVLSGSMEPTIHTGSMCFVNTNKNYKDVKEKDIIAFESASGQMVTHRAINITEEGIETKGDNNDVSDGITTTEKNFKGLTLFSIPYLGYISKFIATKNGMIITISVIVMLMILNLIFREMKKKE